MNKADKTLRTLQKELAVYREEGKNKEMQEAMLHAIIIIEKAKELGYYIDY